VIAAWLVADREVPRKQRRTARRIWLRLMTEHGARLAEVTVSEYVVTRRVEPGIADREVSGAPSSPTPGSSPRSWTASPSTPTPSKPAPSPTDDHTR